MTFDEFEQSLNLNLELADDRFILDVSRTAWNAAIEAAKEALDKATKTAMYKADPYIETDDVLDTLKTK